MAQFFLLSSQPKFYPKNGSLWLFSIYQELRFVNWWGMYITISPTKFSQPVKIKKCLVVLGTNMSRKRFAIKSGAALMLSIFSKEKWFEADVSFRMFWTRHKICSLLLTDFYRIPTIIICPPWNKVIYTYTMLESIESSGNNDHLGFSMKWNYFIPCWINSAISVFHMILCEMKFMKTPSFHKCS